MVRFQLCGDDGVYFARAIDPVFWRDDGASRHNGESSRMSGIRHPVVAPGYDDEWAEPHPRPMASSSLVSASPRLPSYKKRSSRASLQADTATSAFPSH